MSNWVEWPYLWPLSNRILAADPLHPRKQVHNIWSDSRIARLPVDMSCPICFSSGQRSLRSKWADTLFWETPSSVAMHCCVILVRDLVSSLLCGDSDQPSTAGLSSRTSLCHVWIHQPTSSLCCRKGLPPLVLPPRPCGPPWAIRPWWPRLMLQFFHRCKYHKTFCIVTRRVELHLCVTRAAQLVSFYPRPWTCKSIYIHEQGQCLHQAYNLIF